MHISTILFPLLALGVSSAFAAPVLRPRADMMMAHSGNGGNIQTLFKSDASTLPHQTHRIARRGLDEAADYSSSHHPRLKSLTKRGSDQPKDFDQRPRYVHSRHHSHETKPEPTSPESKPKFQDVSSQHMSRALEEPTGEKPKPKNPPTGRVVWLGKKLARLFYHGHTSPQNKHASKGSAHGHDEKHPKVQEAVDV